MGSTEKQFWAAVNVIRHLPQDGPFQPTYNLQLKFYSLYKQAVNGPCNEPKPSFYNVVALKKWTAWKELKNMSKEEAMQDYVDRLKSIVETMSYNQNVEDFLESVGTFYEVMDAEDVDIVFGQVINQVKSRAQESGTNDAQSAKVDDTAVQAIAISNGHAILPADEPSAYDEDKTRIDQEELANSSITSDRLRDFDESSLDSFVSVTPTETGRHTDISRSASTKISRNSPTLPWWRFGLLPELSNRSFVTLTAWPLVLILLNQYLSRRPARR